MKILVAESMSYFGLGGAAKACSGLIEGLAQRGHSSAVATIENRQQLAAEGFKPGGERQHDPSRTVVVAQSIITDLPTWSDGVESLLDDPNS